MKKILILVGICIGFGAILIGLLTWSQHDVQDESHSTIEKFSSDKDFIAYLSNSAKLTDTGIGYRYSGYMSEALIPALPEATTSVPLSGAAEAEKAARVSETTVQVKGIDEPDIVKTNGKEIYFSHQSYWTRWTGFAEKGIGLIESGETKVIEVYPPETISIASEIENGGNLLLSDDILIIFSAGGEKIYGYDVSHQESPEEIWEVELNGTLVSARLYADTIYLITKNWIDNNNPSPLYPMTVKGEALVIQGSDIYHPTNVVPVDVVYTAAMIDPKEGAIKKSLSFVGSSGMSVLYMSKNALYITYTYYPDPVEIYYKFLKERCSDLLSAETMARIDQLMKYDISSRAKLVELEVILEQGGSKERERLQETIYERMEDYFDDYKRDLETTGIVKINLEEFELDKKGEIPGRPLNQFSLDERENYLRIATTTGSGTRSTNDVYVLDEELRVVGSIKDLGVTESIYAVRFLGDKGYVVTFRETDPFFVIDLSNPEKPELKGELKIPGYSSYLHPIDENLILGVGMDDWNVKVSLFDVSSPSKPVEVDNYVVEESWSDVLETHHAFLMDNEHGIFFLPGGTGGYIFSYRGEQLELLNEVHAIRARRAIYIEDYLYVIADTKLVVLDEETWEKVKELEIDFEAETESVPPYPVPLMEEMATQGSLTIPSVAR